MNILLKIFVAPVVVVMTLFVWVCTGFLCLSAGILGILSGLVTICGIAVLLLISVKNGIILLVIAFLISPAGLPTAAAWFLGKVMDLKYAIQDRVYG